MNRLAITRVSLNEKLNKKHLAYIMMDENRNFIDFQIFDEEETLLNKIYVGRVENIVPNINAAFVRISPNQICYLPLEDVKTPIYTKKQSKKKELCIGDEIVVQVVLEAVKTKDPVVSTNLLLAGKYCMLTTDNTTLGVSKKITGDNRVKMNEFLSCYESVAKQDNFGLIIRTNALEAEEDLLLTDVEEVISSFIKLKENASHQCAFALLYSSEQGYISKLKSTDLSSLDGIYTDAEDIFAEIRTKLPYLDDKKLITLYNDDKVSLSTLYNFKGSLSTLIEKKVWLKSGANIIIEQLETMTVIDVNSSKNMSRNPDAILAINKEAATEIARQLRLRNISGIIIVDFLKLDEKATEELLRDFKMQLKKDPNPTQLIDITKLGLVEITRKKVRKSLLEMINK